MTVLQSNSARKEGGSGLLHLRAERRFHSIRQAPLLGKKLYHTVKNARASEASQLIISIWDHTHVFPDFEFLEPTINYTSLEDCPRGVDDLILSPCLVPYVVLVLLSTQLGLAEVVRWRTRSPIRG